MKNIITILLLLLGFVYGFTYSQFAIASETSTGVQKDIEKFKEEMRINIKALDAKIEKLKVQTRDGTTVAQFETINELEQARDGLRKKVDKLQNEGAAGWKKLKNDLKYSLDSLNKKAQRLLK